MARAVSRVLTLSSYTDLRSSKSKHHDLLVPRSKVLRSLYPDLINTSWQVASEDSPIELVTSQERGSGLANTGTHGSRARPSPLWNNMSCGMFAQWDGKRKKIEAQENLQKKKILFGHILLESRLRYFLFLS